MLKPARIGSSIVRRKPEHSPSNSKELRYGRTVHQCNVKHRFVVTDLYALIRIEVSSVRKGSVGFG